MEAVKDVEAFNASITSIAFTAFYYICALKNASLAQLVEQLIRNEQVRGSSPRGGSENCELRIVDFGFITRLAFVIRIQKSGFRNQKMRE